MPELQKTLIFVVVAAVSAGAATITYKTTQPKPTGEYEKVGTDFYEKFDDPAAAQSLRVIVFDEDTATMKPFMVENKNGRWCIPSHHDYPADAKDRLAKTAASVIGIKRDGLQSRRESDHARYGVIAPDSEDSSELKGRGQRITLVGADGKPLADYIIGKKVEGKDDQYYVRIPDEKETYRARLKIDLSTKFSDWIEPDLLKLDRYALNEIVVDKYSIDEQKLRIVGREVSELTRKTDSEPWKLKGLDDKTEEVNPDVLRDVESHLDDLRIVGVRPKPEGIRPDLSVDPKIGRDPLVRAALQGDMQSKGFLVGEDQKGSLHLFSNQGEMTAGTNEGVRYALHFGEIFTGGEFEIEVGFAKKDDDQKQGDKKDADAKTGEKKSGDAKADAADKDAKKPDGKAKDDKAKKDTKRSRYLFVTASFDPKLIGDEPKKPAEPQKPAGLPEEKPVEPAKQTEPSKAAPKEEGKKDAAPSKKDKSDKPEGAARGNDRSGKEELLALADDVKVDAGKSDAKTDGKAAEKKAGPAPSAEKKPAPKAGETKPADSKPAEAKPGENKPAETKPAEAKPDPKAEYEKALAQHKKDLEKYENDLAQHKSKLEKGKKKVDELNKRFGAWYYVISAESFENLRLSRKDLVRPKSKPEDKKPGGEAGFPGGIPGLPGAGTIPGLPGTDKDGAPEEK